MRSHYTWAVIRSVRNSDWSSDHIAVHGVTMAKRTDNLPRTADELERLADYYAAHDTGDEMEGGEWIEPQPMVTTSLRLPADVLDQLKRQARLRHVRYTTYVRSVLEQVADGGPSSDLAQIAERLDRIERAVTVEKGRPAKRQRETA